MSLSRCTLLTSNIQHEINAGSGCGQAEPHGNEHGGGGRHTHQYAKKHRQRKRDEQGLQPAQSEEGTKQCDDGLTILPGYLSKHTVINDCNFNRVFSH